MDHLNSYIYSQVESSTFSTGAHELKLHPVKPSEDFAHYMQMIPETPVSVAPRKTPQQTPAGVRPNPLTRQKNKTQIQVPVPRTASDSVAPGSAITTDLDNQHRLGADGDETSRLNYRTIDEAVSDPNAFLDDALKVTSIGPKASVV